MITVSATTQDVLTRTHEIHLMVESWRGDELLVDNIPVNDGKEEGDRSLSVPERVTFTVPRRADGISWSPIYDNHPLAANGQKLRVKVGVGLPHGVIEWFQRGVFLIQDSEASGDEVTVNAVGLLTLISEARLVSPFQPTGTLVSTLRALIEPALTVVVDAALVNRSVPTDANFSEDRLGAVLELLDAWPASAVADTTGVLRVVPVSNSTTPVISLTDGTGGTIITEATGASSRDGAFNAVVARGTAADGGQVQSVAYDTLGGPKSYGGAFNPLPVPYFFQSPLLTTVAQCNDAAATILARKRREAGRTFHVEMVPNPTLQIGDIVSITTAELTGVICSIETFTLPLVASGGSQLLTVQAVK